MRDTQATIYAKTDVIGASGIVAPTFSVLYSSLGVGWQPAALNDAIASQFGVTAHSAEAKKMFFDNDPAIKMLQRVTVVGDSNTYEIRGVNVWPGHSEALLIKVEGA